MGNDGGSIPTRRELVKEGAKDLTTTQVKEIQTERQEHFWTTCALSHEKLSRPIVSDGLGTLYNKEAVLDHLLSSADTIKAFSRANPKSKEAFKDRLQSLKDVVEVKFHVESEHAQSSAPEEWTCSITNKRLGPRTRAVYLVPCGHAFAESAITELGETCCLECDSIFTVENVIPILSDSQAEKDRLVARLQALDAQGLTHSLKKAGKTKKRKASAIDAKGKEICEANVMDARSPILQSVNIKNSSTASLTAKVLAEQDARKKSRMLGAGNENVQSLFSSKAHKLDAKKNDFMSRGYDIPKNAKR